VGWILRIAKEVAVGAGVPGLQAGIGSLLFVLGVVKVNTHHAHLLTLMIAQKSYQNAGNIEQLAQRVDELTTILQKSKYRGTLSKGAIDRVDHLAK
jgi:hypothetical protein